MAKEKTKTKEEQTPEQKKKQRNYLVLFAIAVLIGAGAYYFMNAKNMSSSTPADNANVSKAPANESSELTSKKWTWTKTQMSDGAEFAPTTGNETAFTLTFQSDMRVLATTDCNNGNGSYELGPDNALTFGPMATTMMFCEGSSETDFYQGISNVGSYKISDGQLWLMLKMDSGTMIFE